MRRCRVSAKTDDRRGRDSSFGRSKLILPCRFVLLTAVSISSRMESIKPGFRTSSIRIQDAIGTALPFILVSLSLEVQEIEICTYPIINPAKNDPRPSILIPSSTHTLSGLRFTTTKIFVPIRVRCLYAIVSVRNSSQVLRTCICEMGPSIPYFG